jgi:hypothetical protein
MSVPSGVSSAGSALRRGLSSLGLVAIPFLVMAWMLPGMSPYTLGTDYLRYPIQHQLVGMFAIANGVWPIYLPRFAMGQSAAALTLGQLHHPISHLGRLFPGYWDGEAREIYAILSLFSLGLALLAVYRLLRRLRVAPAYAFVVAMAGIFNLRMLNLFNYGASLQNYVGYILLCVAIVRYPLSRKGFVDGLFVAVATYLTICGGHPQMAYLGLLGAAFVFIVTPFFLASDSMALLPDRRQALRSVVGAIPWVGLGALLSSAYSVPFYLDFMGAGGARVDQSFRSAAGPFETTTATLLASIFAPLHADVNTSFGGLAPTAMVALVPVLALFGRRNVTPIAWVLWAWCALVALLSVSYELPLYRFFWAYFPLADSFRISGRTTLMLIFPSVLLLAWLFRAPALGEKGVLRPYAVVAAASAAAIVLLDLLPASAVTGDLATPSRIAVLPAGLSSTMQILALLVPTFIVGAGYFGRARRPLMAAVCLLTLVQAGLWMRFGAFVGDKMPTPSWADLTESVQLDAGYRVDPGAGMEPGLGADYRRNAPEPRREWLAPLAGLAFEARSVPDVDAIYRALAGPEPSPVVPMVVDLEPVRQAALGKRGARGSVELIWWTGNSAVYRTRSASSSLLVLREPWRENWLVEVDGVPARTYLIDGLRTAIWLPRGAHRVEVRYPPYASAVGVAGTLLGFGLLLLAAPFFRRGSVGRRLLLGSVLSLTLTLLFVFWFRSLYSSNAFGVAHRWVQPCPVSTFQRVGGCTLPAGFGEESRVRGRR